MMVATQTSARRFAKGVETVLSCLLDRQPDVMRPFAELVRGFLLGGKRLQPVLCYWAWRGSSRSADDSLVIQAGAALEMFHAFALVHDDIIGNSSLRRGRPTLQETHGRDIALLCGDICALWAEQLFDIPVARARQLFAAMRTEAIAGEYLEIVAQPTVEQALQVVRSKTTRYSFMRSLQIGAVLAEAKPSIVDGYAELATSLGEAYRLRDDVLGVFGDPALTGRSNVDDLREARPMVLRAPAEGCSVGPKVMVESGALDAAEERVERALAAALEALEALDIAEDAKTALHHLAVFAARRNS